MDMAAVISHGIRMDESLDIVLKVLKDKDEIIESSCYDRGVGTRRITRTLEGLSELGMVESYTRTDGQKVPVYSLSRKGMLLFGLNGMMHNLLGFHGEIDLDEDTLEEVLESIEECRTKIKGCRKK